MHYGFNDDKSRYDIDAAIADAVDGYVDSAVGDAIADALSTTISDAIDSAVSAAVDSLTARYDALLAQKADEVHYHSAGDITSGTLDDGLISDTGWVYMIGNESSATSQAANSSANFTRWRARGGVVYVQVMLRYNAGGTAGNNLNCGIIAEGYRPSANVEAAAYLGANNDHSATVWIDVNGNIVAHAAGAVVIDKMYCTISYPLG